MLNIKVKSLYIKLVLVIAFAILLILVSGCQVASFSKNNNLNKEKEIVVFAAASLTESFLKMKEEYEKEHKDIQIILNFAGSQVLKNQIQAGAGADMFFSANMKYPKELVSEGVLSGSRLLKEEDIQIFVKNELACISSIPIDAKEFSDVLEIISRDQLRVLLAHEDVPVGKYTKDMLNAYVIAGGSKTYYDAFYKQVVSYENDVKSVLSKVLMSEVDIGIVYQTDALCDLDKLYLIPIDPSYNQVTEYGSLCFSEDDEIQEFYDFVLEGQGQMILKEFGFVTDELVD